jgi:outer membrane lipoprotein carrier protein
MYTRTVRLLAVLFFAHLAAAQTGCGEERDAGSRSRGDGAPTSNTVADAATASLDAAPAKIADAAAVAAETDASPEPAADAASPDAAAKAAPPDAAAVDAGGEAPAKGSSAKVAPAGPGDAGPAKAPAADAGSKSADAGQILAEAGADGGGAEPTELTSLLQKVYRDVSGFEADFEQTYRNRLLDRTRESSGHVWLRPPSKMRWEYAPPSKNLIVADGRFLFVYEPEPNQVVKMPVKGSELPSVMAFLTGGKSLTTDYDVVEVHREKMEPQGLAGLELTPRTPSTVVSRVVLVVSRETGQVQRTVLVEPEGNTNTFVWSKVVTNVAIPESRFTFTPPSGARLVER